MSKPNTPERPPAPSPDEMEVKSVSSQPEAKENQAASSPAQVARQQPIPPPSEPRQYRAIGVVRGQYAPCAEQITRGALMTSSDGTPVDAVLLGRVMSLVKNHVDLQQSHLWVVYPRTGQHDGNLHVQIVGVWEPETLSEEYKQQDETVADGEKDSPESEPLPVSSTEVNDNYFSIRGEVIYYAQDREYAVVKIKQAPRKNDDRPKFFKLKLTGKLPGKAVGHFWEFHVQREGNDLVIQESHNMGALPIKRRFNKKPYGQSRYGGGFKRGGRSSAPISKGPRTYSDSPKSPSKPKPKPIKPSQK
ncbi:hypothetical protein [Zarconia navalis]|uniref:hypothetical protein n=1 Tax=Zarconia navalis TaxID=2992134 RepID=UPI0021F83498|nr:hypothetical protein [Zarconia navalis]